MSEEKKRRKIQKVSRTCIVCGKTFLASFHKRQYCSRKCYDKSFYSKNAKAIRAYQSLHNVELCETSEGYAKYREARRRSRRKIYERKHPGCKPYRPTESRRIPDWAVKGQEIMDRRSVFVPGNMSDEKVLAANAIYEQQHAAKNSKPKRVKTIFSSR